MNKETSGILTLILIYIFGIVMLVTSIDDLKYIITGKADDINDMIENGEELKRGDHVSIKLEYALDWYAETNKRTRRSSNHSYHALGVLDDGRIVSIKVRVASKEYYKLEDLIDETYDYLNGDRTLPPTPVILKGGLLDLDKQVEQYFNSALNYIGYSQSDAIYLEIDTNQSHFYLMFGFVFGLVVTVFGTIFIILLIKEKNNKKIASKSFVVQQFEDELAFSSGIPCKRSSNVDLQTENNNKEKNSNQDENINDEDKNEDKNENKFESKFTLKKD